MRVAVVEDNRPLADSLCLLLNACGHEARAAYTGPDGLRLAAEWRPDAVITDVGLPGCDGFEVARRLRRDGEGRPLVVAVTACDSDDVRWRGRQAGFDHFFAKPVELDDLLRVLESGTGPTKRDAR
jgi:DNA-binding response OmpR family regulator